VPPAAVEASSPTQASTASCRFQAGCPVPPTTEIPCRGNNRQLSELFCSYLLHFKSFLRNPTASLAGTKPTALAAKPALEGRCWARFKVGEAAVATNERRVQFAEAADDVSLPAAAHPPAGGGGAER